MTPKALRKARAAAIPSTAPLFDEDAVLAVLALTAPTVDSEERAAAVFEGLADTVGKSIVPTELSGSAKMFEFAGWERAQELARTWLPTVAKFDRLSAAKRSAFLQEFNDLLPVAGLGMKLDVRGLMVLVPRQSTIFEVCLRAFIPFLVPNGWAPRRLGQCQYEECGQWFLRPEPKRGSVPLYCSPQHANLARVRAFREKQRPDGSA